jgi:hypothetical protein
MERHESIRIEGVHVILSLTFFPQFGWVLKKINHVKNSRKDDSEFGQEY